MTTNIWTVRAALWERVALKLTQPEPEPRPTFKLTPPTCRICLGENFTHGTIGTALCPNWKYTRGTARFERMVARYAGRRPQAMAALMAELKAALGGAR